MFSFGVGALLDLPNMSVMVMGLDDWQAHSAKEVSEPRLVAALQRRVGEYVERLLLTPGSDPENREQSSGLPHGVPVSSFPRWLRCTACNTIATIDSGLFKFKGDPFRAERSRYVHEGCSKNRGRTPPTAAPIRFLLACREGHISDFPWYDFVHRGSTSCKGSRLVLTEFDVSGDIANIRVTCQTCRASHVLGEVTAPNSPLTLRCNGHLPHLRSKQDKPCQEATKLMTLGASNMWFPLSMSALSIPQHIDPVAKVVEENWSVLQRAKNRDIVEFIVEDKPLIFEAFSVDDIWQAVEARRSQPDTPEDDPTNDVEDLKMPEWQALCNPTSSHQDDDFELEEVAPPATFEALFEPTVKVKRLREVRALYGFTRIESNGDFTDATSVQDGRYTSLSRKPLDWLPAAETRGEGIFLRFKESALRDWEARPEVKVLEAAFRDSHRKWRKKRDLEPIDEGFGGIRYVLIHSLAHALMRQIVLEAGYTSASIRERLYSRQVTDDGGSMAGILLYTAASDSEGTLGGLVRLGDPQTLGRHLQQTLEAMRLCASDPLCAEHPPNDDDGGRGVHAACCHACLFAPETSCERGNRYLDRAVLVPTLARDDVAFFDGYLH
jgi:hypothetical protein